MRTISIIIMQGILRRSSFKKHKIAELLLLPFIDYRLLSFPEEVFARNFDILVDYDVADDVSYKLPEGAVIEDALHIHLNVRGATVRSDGGEGAPPAVLSCTRSEATS